MPVRYEIDPPEVKVRDVEVGPSPLNHSLRFKSSLIERGMCVLCVCVCVCCVCVCVCVCAYVGNMAYRPFELYCSRRQDEQRCCLDLLQLGNGSTPVHVPAQLLRGLSP